MSYAPQTFSITHKSSAICHIRTRLINRSPVCFIVQHINMVRGVDMGQRWVDEEIIGCDLGDARLNRRSGMILENLGERPDKSLPTAFQDWANTKAAYRFFSNKNVSEDKILEGHLAASALRIQATDGPILILQDTTEFSFKRSSPEKVGFTK